ncbi:Phloem protein 2-like [Macleaya cordata]|uniref:Phloem protein 2-like n=1 Tax=Macleaya cordata TaxID=56857 RepID=A0A200QPN3_MACCD|nr:Phloem protein 2-like [Macleaya cordata]
MASNPHFVADNNAKKRDGDTHRIQPRGLDIIWGNDPRYWRVPTADDPRAMEGRDAPLELLQVCWLEVTGSMKLQKFELRPGKYNISFRISMKRDAFGWSGMPIYIMAKIGKKGKYIWRSANLTSSDNEPFEIPEGEPLQIEVSPGSNEEDEELHFGLYEVWKGRWKGGLQIYEAIIRPEKAK